MIEYLDHMMELYVFPKEINKCLIATHQTVKQLILKLLILLLLFLLLHIQHVEVSDSAKSLGSNNNLTTYH